MEYKFTRGYSYPIRVDERLLTSLGRIGEIARNNSNRKIISDNKITKEEMDGNFSNDLDSFERAYKVRSALMDIERNIPKYSCQFSSGTSVESSHLEDIVDSLQNEPSEIKKVEATYGSFGGCRFNYRFDSGLSNKVWISIEGERSEVNDIRVQVEGALRSSHPDLKIFYHPSAPTLVGLSILICWVFFGVRVILPIIGGSSLNGGLQAVAVGLSLAVITALASFVSFLYGKMLPQVLFAFGAHHRQRSSTVMFIVWMIAACAAPIVLASLGLT